MNFFKNIIFGTFFIFSFCNYIPPPVKNINEKEKVVFVFFNNCDKTWQKYLVDKVSTFYNVTGYYNTSINLPKEAYYKPNNRYRADSLLSFLSRYNLKFDRIIAVTDKPISCTRDGWEDRSVLGLAFPSLKRCVVSSFKLHTDIDKCLNVILHEVGHTYGLNHCPTTTCFMSVGKVVNTKYGPVLCKTCTNLLINFLKAR